MEAGAPLLVIGCSDPGTVSYLTQLLASARVQIAIAEDGQRVIRMLKADDPPAMALLDMDLPAPGVQLVREVRRLQNLRNIWLVLMSAESSSLRARAALACGADGFLALPADPAELTSLVSAAERGRRSRYALRRAPEAHSRPLPGFRTAEIAG